MIEIQNVSFHYAGGSSSGIEDIDLTIQDGECLLLCGASGCGKTTVTRLINGLIPLFFKGELTGETLVNGVKVREKELYDLAGVVGSVFQNPRSQFFSVDTDGEIVFGPENIGLAKEEILKRKNMVVNALHLENLLERSLFDLSGGEKQKIACASVAALLPEIIILDEPSSNLDWKAIRDLREVIKLWKSQGKTIIISEHRLWYLRDVIDRAVFMSGGRIRREWKGEEFASLSEKELASYELRPVQLEERYIRQFSVESAADSAGHGVAQSGGSSETTGAAPRIKKEVELSDFYFTYTPKKYLFLKKKLTPEDESICDLRIRNLTVNEGEIIGVIGDNGSGKSTFLRCLCGLEKSCTGKLTIDGKTCSGKDLTKICYMVMQDVNHQLFTDSVLKEVLLSMKQQNKKEAQEILKGLDLEEYMDKHPMALSGGQKQRVAIASATAADARLLLFDEPTSGLDYRHMREVAGLLKSLSKEGKTVFVSTHDPELVALCCDRVIQISDGYATDLFADLAVSGRGQKSSQDP